MKTKLRTFAPKQILRKPIKKVVKKWLKYSVHMTKPLRKTCASLWKHTIITFSFRFYYKFFVYNVIQTSCFFFLEKSSRLKVADMFRRPSVLIETLKRSFKLLYPNVRNSVPYTYLTVTFFSQSHAILSWVTGISHRQTDVSKMKTVMAQIFPSFMRNILVHGHK